MEIQITGRNVKLIPAVRSYIERRLAKLNRHLPDIIELKVEVAMENTRAAEQRFVAQVTIESGSTLLRGEGRGGEMTSSLPLIRWLPLWTGRLNATGGTK